MTIEQIVAVAVSPVADDRIARVEQGIAEQIGYGRDALMDAALIDLHAWQEIAERHRRSSCQERGLCTDPCPDIQAADAALDRLDALWSTAASPDSGAKS